jgi:hypothetical protein
VEGLARDGFFAAIAVFRFFKLDARKPPFNV